MRRCTYRRWSWLAAVAVLILATVGFVPAASAVGLPTVTSLSPQSGSVNGGQVLVITGTNLDGATAVNFGSTVVNPPFPYDPSTGGVVLLGDATATIMSSGTLRLPSSATVLP